MAKQVAHFFLSKNKILDLAPGENATFPNKGYRNVPYFIHRNQ